MKSGVFGQWRSVESGVCGEWRVCGELRVWGELPNLNKNHSFENLSKMIYFF